jgi:hypothetical protein
MKGSAHLAAALEWAATASLHVYIVATLGCTHVLKEYFVAFQLQDGHQAPSTAASAAKTGMTQQEKIGFVQKMRQNVYLQHAISIIIK